MANVDSTSGYPSRFARLRVKTLFVKRFPNQTHSAFLPTRNIVEVQAKSLKQQFLFAGSVFFAK